VFAFSQGLWGIAFKADDGEIGVEDAIYED